MRYNRMRLSTLQMMIEREIIDIEKTHDVFVEGLNFPECEMYQQGDGHWCETIYAKVMVNGEVKDYELEWDTEEEEITSVMSGNQEDDDEDGDELPSNVVARLNYAAQALDTLELSPAEDVDVNEELPCEVTTIRMDYPFEIEGNGSYNVYKISPAKTWGELLTETIKVFQREYNAGKAVAPHVLSDYIIERVDVYQSCDSGMATIGIGS